MLTFKALKHDRHAKLDTKACRMQDLIYDGTYTWGWSLQEPESLLLNHSHAFVSSRWRKDEVFRTADGLSVSRWKHFTLVNGFCASSCFSDSSPQHQKFITVISTGRGITVAVDRLPRARGKQGGVNGAPCTNLCLLPKDTHSQTFKIASLWDLSQRRLISCKYSGSINLGQHKCTFDRGSEEKCKTKSVSKIYFKVETEEADSNNISCMRRFCFNLQRVCPFKWCSSSKEVGCWRKSFVSSSFCCPI